MYSQLYFKILDLANRYFLFLGVSAISGFSVEYEKHSKGSTCSKLKVTKKDLKRVYKAAILHSIDASFAVCRALQMYLEDSNDLTICYIFALIKSLLMISQINIIIKTHLLKTLWCRYEQFALKFREKWITQYDYKKIPTGLRLDACLVGLCIWFIIVLPVSFAIHLFAFKNLPILLHTILPQKMQDSLIVFGPSALLYTYYSLGFSAIGLQYSFMVIIYFVTAMPLLKNEFKGGLNQAKYITKRSLRHPYNLVKEYMALELIHYQGMNAHGIMIVIGEIMISQFILYCNYTVIRHWDQLKTIMKCLIIIMSFDMTAVWCAILELSGRVHGSSTNLLESWKFLESKSEVEAKFMRKFMKRCRPLAVGFEGVRKIERLSVLEFIDRIVSSTVRTLLLLE